VWQKTLCSCVFPSFKKFYGHLKTTGSLVRTPYSPIKFQAWALPTPKGKSINHTNVPLSHAHVLPSCHLCLCDPIRVHFFSQSRKDVFSG